MNVAKLSGIDDDLVLSLILATRLTDYYFKNKLLTFAELYEDISDEETQFIDWVKSIEAEDIGITTPYYGLEEPSSDTEFVAVSSVRNVVNTLDQSKTYNNTDYIPAHVNTDWQRLISAIKQEVGEDIAINSGYRSPAYQALVFCYHLNGKMSPTEAIKRSAIPGYSQHSLTTNTAVDIALAGHKSEEFGSSNAYNWMLDNAGKFNFVLSYPLNNPLGMDFEPWHWQWQQLS